MTEDPLLASLLAAVDANPDDVPLRLHVAELLLTRGRAADALAHCGVVLQRDPSNAQGIALLSRATAALTGAPRPAPNFDWRAAEEQVRDIMPPPFVTEPVVDQPEPVLAADGPESPSVPSNVRLVDVGGMEQVKQRLESAFLGPMRNPELAKMYGKSLRGGLLLYGPPGCGKTFIAKAVAGELGARFYSVSLADVLDQWLGGPERNIKEIFLTARRNAPCVLFLDEVDAIGYRRAKIGSGWTGLRSAVNQLLTEMDSVGSDNDGVFILSATNHPWDVDPALRRPGRFDRTVLVLPPDAGARETILRYHLRDRPLSGIDVALLVRRTGDFSGADLAHLVDSAAELALAESVRTGQVRPIGMPDFLTALGEVGPSTGAWLQTARNVAQFANASGEYDELLAYLKSRKLV
jgi:SpoVK/Ycf46/Vps4 family AAA+-type ATPase